MRPVEQALLRLHWGRKWRVTRVIVHVDNWAGFDPLEYRTIGGYLIEVLHICLLLAAEHDLEIAAL